MRKYFSRAFKCQSLNSNPKGCSHRRLTSQGLFLLSAFHRFFCDLLCGLGRPSFVQVFSESPAHPSWSGCTCLLACSSKRTGWWVLTPLSGAPGTPWSIIPPFLPSISKHHHSCIPATEATLWCSCCPWRRPTPASWPSARNAVCRR